MTRYRRGFYVFVIFGGGSFFFVIDGDGFEFREIVFLPDQPGLVGIIERGIIEFPLVPKPKFG